MNADSLLERAGRLRSYPVPKRSLARFLQSVAEREPLDLWTLIRTGEEYVRVTMELLEALVEADCVTVDADGKLRLTDDGRALCESLGVRAAPEPAVTGLGACGLKLTESFQKILETLRVIYTEVVPKDRFDQAPLLPEAAILKAYYIWRRGDVVGKRIVCVGDDDLLSLAFALTGETAGTLAVDIDDRLLGLIADYAKKHGLSVEVLEHDVTEPIPEAHRSGYDTFVTEPPDTVNGVTLFVSRGVELLRDEPGTTGYCGVSTTACPPAGIAAIQRNFLEMGLRISAWLPKFNRYPPVRTELKHVEVPGFYDPFYPPRTVWYVSDLVRLKTTSAARPLIDGKFTEPIADYEADALEYR